MKPPIVLRPGLKKKARGPRHIPAKDGDAELRERAIRFAMFQIHFGHDPRTRLEKHPMFAALIEEAISEAKRRLQK